jgi:TPP-dependent pyruvate/acetoin dehydrogenase alpha subunit
MNTAIPEARPHDLDVSAEELSVLYRGLLLVRRAEERLSALFADGVVPGFIHLSVGQEAVPVGVTRHLRLEDTVASTHRGHGHAIAKGLPLRGFFAELLGREEGLCKGRGGSMHVADLSVGMLGANGIVGACSSIALGSALAHKTLDRRAIAVVFLGDGALAEGILHESLNMAKLLTLPLLFVCENNGWSEFSPTDRQIAFTLQRLSAAYAIPYDRVDGNDVVAVSTAAHAIVADVRAGCGPSVLECFTHRVRGHYEGDAQKYRSAEEINGLATRDPVRIAAERLLTMGVEQKMLDQTTQEIEAEISFAVTAAREGRDPNFEIARQDVYSPIEPT